MSEAKSGRDPLRSCGLDFGTSNSAVALPSGHVLAIDPGAPSPRLFRSVLFFPEEGKRVLAGHAAIAEYLERSEGRFIQSVKGWLPSSSFTATVIRNQRLKLEDLIAILLRRIREQAEAVLGLPLEEVTLGRPAVFSPEPEDDRRAEERLRRAAELAGFQHIEFLIEPIAAALAYESQLARDELVLVADFGAGTSDLTLMRLGPGRGTSDRRGDVIASDGVHIGGDRFDAEIMRHKLLRHFGAGSTYTTFGDKRMPIPNHILGKLLSWHEMSFIRERSTQQLIDHMLHASSDVPAIEALYDLVEENLGYRLFRAIEAAKIRLSSSEATTIDFEEARVSIHEPITRREFEQFSRPLLDGLEACAEGLLARAQLDRRAIDSVFLTGGSSQIPAVRHLFARLFGEPKLRTADAFTSVAAGLGRASGTRSPLATA